jgi:hypothetical protein
MNVKPLCVSSNRFRETQPKQEGDSMSKASEPVQRDDESLGDFYGRKHDWEVDAGMWCYQCGGLARLLGDWKPGYKRLCHSCDALKNGEGEVSHHDCVRCPKCGSMWSPCEGDNYDLLGDGEHDVTCCECEHEFEITTTIMYKFTSPARIANGDSDPETGDESEDDD